MNDKEKSLRAFVNQIERLTLLESVAIQCIKTFTYNTPGGGTCRGPQAIEAKETLEKLKESKERCLLNFLDEL